MVSVLENLNKEEKLVFKLRNLFESFGYEKLSVNLLEDYESYYLHGELIKTESLLKVIDPQGKLYVLRPDLTMPIAKKIGSESKTEALPYKVYYADDIFRIDNKNFGNINQQKQMGIELLGDKSSYSDYEVIKLAVEALKAISPKFHIDISHSEFLKLIFEKTKLNFEEREYIVASLQNRALSDLEKFLEKFEMDSNIKELILNIPKLYGDFDKVVAMIEEFDAKLNIFGQILNELKELKEILPMDKIELDFSLVNNLNYYTGIIFKGYLEGISKGILQGGRYDNLTEKFGKKMDAVGFAINLQEVFDKILTEEFRQINELLLYKDIKNLPQTAEKLRSEGHRLRVEKYSDTLMNDIDKLRKKYKKIYVFEDEKAGEI